MGSARILGIEPAVERTETDFDPGAKYHIPGNAHTRYFLSHVMQFQFHRALCDAAGYQGPLHNCSIYNSKPAGEKLGAMLAMDEPWPEPWKRSPGKGIWMQTRSLIIFSRLWLG